MIKAQIEQDIKTALLAGNKEKVTTLRGLKSVILYEEVAQGLRDEGVSEDTVISILQKESKKRQESADMYKKAAANDKAAAELREKTIIDSYLPEQLTDEDIEVAVNESIDNLQAEGMKDMGRVVADVKKRTSGAAEGSVIARIVKEKLA